MMMRNDHRQLQTIDYTSPPTKVALAATPLFYRSDQFINNARELAASGNCTAEAFDTRCHIAFAPSKQLWNPVSRVGVIFHGGALVDPRSYSPLAATLRDRYGLPVVVTIFNRDISLRAGECRTFRRRFAQVEFPDVQKWVFVGHGLGGVAATTDVWQNKYSSTNATDVDPTSVGGLALLGADVQNVGCGIINFRGTGLPMAVVTASEDRILNRTRFDTNRQYTSNTTFFMEIFGGNHHQFGSYNFTGRSQILGQRDGSAFVPDRVQFDLTAGAIYNVAARTNETLAQRVPGTTEGGPTNAPTNNDTTLPRCPPDLNSGASMTVGMYGSNFYAFVFALVFFWLRKKF